jgi:hypothetical protein
MARTLPPLPQASQTNLKASTLVPMAQIPPSHPLPLVHHLLTSASVTGDPETIASTGAAQRKKSDSTRNSTAPGTQRNGIATKKAWTPITTSSHLTRGALSPWLHAMREARQSRTGTERRHEHPSTTLMAGDMHDERTNDDEQSRQQRSGQSFELELDGWMIPKQAFR